MLQGLDASDGPFDHRVTVEVTDGVLDLKFVQRLGDATVSTITATRTTAG